VTGSAGIRWLRVLLYPLAALLALLTLTVTYLSTSQDALKPIAAYFTKQLTGRELTIDGPLDLDLSLRPRVTATRVRFGNTDGASSVDMVSADFITVQIDLLDLLDRRVHLLDLDATGVAIHLEDKVDGKPNWTFSYNKDHWAREFNWSFMLQGLHLQDARVHALIGDLKPISLDIPELTEITDDNGNLILSGNGTLNGNAWQLEGHIGTLDELLAAGRIGLDLNLTFDDTDLSAAGVIGNLELLRNVDLELTLHGPDASLLGDLFGMAEVFAGDIAMTASVDPRDDAHAIDVTGNIAAFAIAATGQVADLTNLDGWDLQMDMRGPDAAVVGKVLQIPGFPEGPFEVKGRLQLSGGDLDLTGVDITTEHAVLTLNADFVEFPRREGAFGSVHLIGSDISYFGRLLRMPHLPAAPFELNAELGADAGRLKAALTVGTHSLTVDGSIEGLPSFDGTRLNARVTGAEIADLTHLAGLTDSITGSYDASGVITIDDGGMIAQMVELNSGPFEITGRAVLPALTRLDRFDVSARLAVSSIGSAAGFFGIDGLPDQPATIQADIQSRDTGYRLVGSSLTYKSVQGSAVGNLGELTGLPGIELQITLEGPDINSLTSEVATATDPTKPVEFRMTSNLRGLESAIEIAGFELETDGGSISMDGELGLNGGFIGTDLVITGAGPSLYELMPSVPRYVPPDQPFRIQSHVRYPVKGLLELDGAKLGIGSVQIELDGQLDLNDQARTVLSVRASGNSIIELGRISDWALPDIPFSLLSKLDGSTDAITVSQLEITWGDSDFTATGSLDLTGKPAVVLKGTSDRMVLTDLHKAIFGEPEPLNLLGDANRLILDVPINLDEFSAYDATIDIQIAKFRGIRVNLDDVTLTLVSADGMLELEQLAFRDDTGTFDASGRLWEEDDTAHLELKLLGTDADLGIFTSPDQARETIPRYTLDVDITGQGQTVAGLAASLDGSLLISSDGGSIDHENLERFAGSFLGNVFDTLNPAAKDDLLADMECMVLNATLTDGKLNLEPGYVIRTDEVNMYVYGEADLATERLDLSLHTQARRGIGISAATITNPYFKIGGTLANPKLQLDPASATVASSVAIATVGLSILIRGFWDRLMGEENPCPEFLKHNRQENQPSG
jgi:uncharacterized protein involved in outer membrane biogenesis